MVRILGISGSLRSGSFNTALLRAAQSLASEVVSIEIATLRGIPLYDGDMEKKDGIPEAVRSLKEKMVACDGVLLSTPEYNNGIPGVTKNAIDWLSRPADDIRRVFGNKPWAVIGASAGGWGTILSQNAWLPVLRTLGTRQWSGGRLLVSRAAQVFDAEGKLVDQNIAGQLATFVAGFAQFASGR